MLYTQRDFMSNPESARPLAISHGRLGNDVHELIGTGLKHMETYLI